MHTRDMCDAADGYLAPTQRRHPYIESATTSAGAKTTGLEEEDGERSSDNETLSDVEGKAAVPPSKLVSIVLDMCSSLYDSGRVVNMDNYYTSPEVAVALAQRQVFIGVPAGLTEAVFLRQFGTKRRKHRKWSVGHTRWCPIKNTV